MMGNGWTISHKTPARAAGGTCLRVFRQGFTLTELLVVIVIMTLLLVIAVPAFNYMTGSRSIEAAQNLAGAMIQRARNAALAEGGRYCGVFFYEDPVSRRTTMTIVQVSEPGDPDYKAWQAGVTYSGPVDGRHGDRVTYVTRDGNFGNKPITYLWEALQDNTNSHPPDSIPLVGSPGNNYPTAYKNLDWKVVAPGDTTPLDADDINAGTQQLPKGVRIQVVVQPQWYNNQLTDSYMTTGLILFDPQGHLDVNHEFRIQADTTVGQAMKLAAVAPSLYSGIGLAVYDRAAFEANHPATTENGVTIDAFKASDGDGIYTPPFLMNPDGNMNPPYDVNRFNTDEINEEKWLDQNAVRIMIGRSNGVLMGGTP